MNTIIAAIDQRIAEIKPELDRLIAARLALTDAPPAAPPSTAPQRVAAKKARRQRQPALSFDAALAGTRDAIADGPRKVGAICTALGYARNPRVENLIRQALEQLGAVQTQQGWTLSSADEPPATGNGHGRTAVQAAAPPQEDLEQAYLERAILRELRSAPLLPTVLANVIDAPPDQVVRACERLHVENQLEHFPDGRYVA